MPKNTGYSIHPHHHWPKKFYVTKDGFPVPPLVMLSHKQALERLRECDER